MLQMELKVIYAVDIKNSINRILKTPLGSRVMRPEFGSSLYLLRDRKFDDTFKVLATKYIFEAINKHEPRVKVQSVDFSLDVVNGKVSFLIYLSNGEEVEVKNE